MRKDAVLRDYREQLARHVGRELDDVTSFDPDPFAVRAGNADQPRKVRLGNAEKLRFLSSHDVRPIGSRLRDTRQNADVAGRVWSDRALMQGLKPCRRLQIRSLAPALPGAGHAANQYRQSIRRPKPGEMMAQHRRKAAFRTMQHALAAAALRDGVTTARHQPGAKTAGAPVDSDKSSRPSTG